MHPQNETMEERIRNEWNAYCSKVEAMGFPPPKDATATFFLTILRRELLRTHNEALEKAAHALDKAKVTEKDCVHATRESAFLLSAFRHAMEQTNLGIEKSIKIIQSLKD